MFETQQRRNRRQNWLMLVKKRTGTRVSFTEALSAPKAVCKRWPNILERNNSSRSCTLQCPLISRSSLSLSLSLACVKPQFSPQSSEKLQLEVEAGDLSENVDRQQTSRLNSQCSLALIGDETFLVSFPKRSSSQLFLVSCLLQLAPVSFSPSLNHPVATSELLWELRPQPTVSSAHPTTYPLWWLDDAWNWRALVRVFGCRASLFRANSRELRNNGAGRGGASNNSSNNNDIEYKQNIYFSSQYESDMSIYVGI